MKDYYRQRAPQYDKFYEVPERREDLDRLKAWLIERVRGRVVLEVAAGTGHWTEAAASVAKQVTATDYNAETLSIARKRRLGSHVKLLAADAYALPEFPNGFEVGMAHMWWSHVEYERQLEFLSHFRSRLQPRARLLMIDQFYVEGFCSPASKQDALGNQYTIRTLDDGSSHEIVKNFFTLPEIEQSVSEVCEDVEVVVLQHFWALSARFKNSAG